MGEILSSGPIADGVNVGSRVDKNVKYRRSTLAILSNYLYCYISNKDLVPVEDRKSLNDMCPGDLSEVNLDDSLGVLLKTLPRVPRWSMDDGVKYFSKLDEARRICKMEAVLVPKDKRNETKAAEQVKVYRSLIVLRNLPLAISIAHTFHDRGIDLEDLVQEAILGLETSVDVFDLSRGNTFSTFANRVIVNKLVGITEKEYTIGRKTKENGFAEDDKLALWDTGLKGPLVRPTEAHVADTDETASVLKVLTALTKRELEFAKVLFGFDGGGGCTVPVASSKLGISKKRGYELVDQISKKGKQLLGVD